MCGIAAFGLFLFYVGMVDYMHPLFAIGLAAMIAVLAVFAFCPPD